MASGIKLALLPHRDNNRQPRYHLARDDGSAWCGAVAVGETRVNGQAWTLVDEAEGHECWNCPRSKTAEERPSTPRPRPLEPDKPVELWAHKDGRAHIFKSDNGVSRCSNVPLNHKWFRSSGKMSRVSCRLCLRAVDQLEGYERPTHTSRDNVRLKRDWDEMLRRWNAGEARCEARTV